MPTDPIANALAAVLARLEQPEWQRDTHATHELIGTNLDGLSHTIDEPDWDPLRRRVQAALRQIRPQYKLAILGMARDEAAHLAEWVAHYLAIGAEHLFIYTNDNSDGTDELLRWFTRNAPVTALFTDVAPGTNVQLKNYDHAFFLLPALRLYEWVVVVDADEFLVPGAQFDHQLPSMLDSAPRDAAAITFPWLWRLWEPHFERRPGFLAERFEHAIPHVLFKSAVRLHRATGLSAVHIPTLEQGELVLDTEFRPIPPQEIWAERFKSRRGGWVDHYWGRSFEEFVLKKRRGDALAIPGGDFKRDYEDFFSWTEAYSSSNHIPTPAAVITRMKDVYARFAADPSFAALSSRLASRYEAKARRLRGDRDLRALFERLRRVAMPGGESGAIPEAPSE